jgi:hypothetical protein
MGRVPAGENTMMQRLATYTVTLEVPAGVPEATLDQLCQVLDLIDLRERLESAAELAVRHNRVLSRYVSVDAEE